MACGYKRQEPLLKGEIQNTVSLVSCRRQSGLLLHAKMQKGRIVQTAHAAIPCRVELTNYRLEEASNDPEEKNRCGYGVKQEIK